MARLFARARDNAPSIVFLDEIDAVAAARGEVGGYADRMLNQLLAEIDGLRGHGRVMVIGATNRPDILDPALTRGGRLSRMISVGLPAAAGRRRLLDLPPPRCRCTRWTWTCWPGAPTACPAPTSKPSASRRLSGHVR